MRRRTILRAILGAVISPILLIAQKIPTTPIMGSEINWEVDWSTLRYDNRLSEKFMREFDIRGKINWSYISSY